MDYKYEVALSFAGEDRAFADVVAKGLCDAGVEVFYDDFYAEDLWGEDLAVKLREVYHSSSQFCIMIISNPTSCLFPLLSKKCPYFLSPYLVISIGYTCRC